VPDLQAAPGTALSNAVPAQQVPATGSSRRYVLTFVGVAVAVVLIDRVTKALALEHLADGRVIPVVDPWFQLRLVFNPGAAFGFAGGYTVVITLVALAIVAVIVRIAPRLRSIAWAIALGGILGGALGNLIDRLTREPGPLRGYVIDFFEWPGFPVFNCADVAIVTSVALVFVLSLRDVPYDGRRPPEVDEAA
jgi:signal peptidase II